MNKAARIILVISGTASLVVGIIGAFLPVLPTTPFVLLAAYCYVRSSPRMYTWLMNSRFAGRHVNNVLAGHGIPLSVKVVAVAISFFMIGYVCVFRTDSFLIRMLLGLLFAVQVIFMARIKTLKEPVHAPEPKSLNLES